jgi:hypothetical protein
MYVENKTRRAKHQLLFVCVQNELVNYMAGLTEYLLNTCSNIGDLTFAVVLEKNKKCESLTDRQTDNRRSEKLTLVQWFENVNYR